MVTAGIIAVAAISSYMGQEAAKGNREAAQKMAANAYQEIAKLGLPPDQSRQLLLQNFKSAGVFAPEMEKDIDAGISQVAQIQEDPSLRNAQTQALGMMQQKAQGGLDVQDQAALNQVRDQVARDTESKRQQIIQNYQQRGMGGSGSELASQLIGAQSGANRQALANDQIASDASNRALQALSSSSDMASKLRSQDFNVASTKANAADEMKRFNVGNQIALQARNVNANNNAQQYNLANQQRLSDMNTNQANQETQRQSQAQRQYWLDQAQLAGMKSNAMTNNAQVLNQQGNQQAQNYQNMGNGVMQGLGAYASYNARNPSSTTTPATTNTGSINNVSASGAGLGNDYGYAVPVDGGGSTPTFYGDVKKPTSQLGNDYSYQPNFAHGGMIPGVPKVPHVDTEENDVVKAKLSPGELVIPATVTEHGPHAVFGFASALIKPKGKK